MIIEQKGSKLINSHEFETAKFGVDDDDMPFLISLLRDKIYSDKMAAVIREYGTNAVDAHIEAGYPEKPFRITLPTRLDQEFKVRDFGLGMDHEKIKNLYTRYCKSTKRQSNDANGALGLGCKAGFAYGDNFVVVSYFGGKKSTYNIVAGPDGSGQAILLDQSKTDEPSGLEVIIPVPDHEITTFRKKAASIYKHFRVQPEVSDDPDDFDMSFDVHFEGDFWKLLKKENDGYWKRHIQPLAVMGDVAYPINIDLLNSKFGYEYNYLSNISLVLNFDIGTLDINPSRESLEYTDKTYAAIKGRLVDFQNSLSQSATKSISGAEDLLSAYKSLKAFQSDLPKNLTKSKATIPFEWNGIKLDKDCVIHANSGVSATSFGFFNRSGLSASRLKRINYGSSHGTSYIEISDRYRYLFVPVGEKLNWKMYSINQYFEENGEDHSLMIFSFEDQKAYDTFAEKNCIKHYSKENFQSVKTIEKEPPKVMVDGKKRAASYCPKRNCKVFEFRGYSGICDEKGCWAPVAKEDIPQTAYFVEINRYVPVVESCDGLKNSNLREKVEIMSKILGIKPPKIYGVKSVDVDKFKDCWIEIGSWFLSHVEEFRRSKLLKDLVRANSFSARSSFAFLKKKLDKINSSHIINRTISYLWEQNNTFSDSSFLVGFPYDFEATYEAEKERLGIHEKVKRRIENIKKAYPLLKDVERSYNYTESEDIVDYVIGIDYLRNSNKKA